MPKFLEAKLKAEYGADSKIPYKVMNAKGYMRGNKETAKGAALDAKHAADQKKGKKSSKRSSGLSSATPSGAVSTRPRVLNNPKTLSGRRQASHQAAYGS